jgi:hypothetical protein
MMDIVSSIAPGDDRLASNFMSGYNPVSRNGEQTRNAFIDAYEWNSVSDTQDQSSDNAWRFHTAASLLAGGLGAGAQPVERAQNAEQMSAASADQMRKDGQFPFNEWASVVPGIICVAARNRSGTYRSMVAAETAMPVIACAQKLCTADNADFRFAGIARSPSVRPYDDGRGPTMDEFFTMSIAGAVTMLNNGNGDIGVGDPVEWTFYDDADVAIQMRPQRQKMGPRTIVLRTATNTSARTFGRALISARKGDWIDILITP